MTHFFNMVRVITFMQEPAASIIRATKSSILRSYRYTECLGDTRIALSPSPPPNQKFASMSLGLSIVGD